MTTDIIIIDIDGRELMLEVEVHRAEPMTHHYPGCPAEFEIVGGSTRDGDILNDDILDSLVENETDQIWQKLEDLSEYTRDDYLLEKHKDQARDRHLEDRLRRLGPSH